MIPPLTTTLDDDVANMRKVLPQVVAEIERRALAAQPAPPTEALRLLRELYDRTLLRNEARLKSDWLRIRGGPEQEENEAIERLRVAARLQDKTLAEARRYLATEGEAGT